MKVLVLSSKSSHEDISVYGSDLLEELKKATQVISYDHVDANFSNIPELKDDDEKIVLFNHFALSNGFATFSELLPTFKNIKYLLSPYSAYEGLDLALLKKMGIKYRNNGGANANSVAQYALTVMLMLLSKVPVFTQEMKMPDGSVLGEEFHHKTAGIIGMGNVGRSLLKSLNGLGIQTVYYNRTNAEVDAEKVSIDEVLQQDIIFITIATNDQTIALLKDLPGQLTSHQYLIDVSAADELYDKRKVVELLNDDLLQGYGLEIFDTKHLKLESTKNFIATPHIAWCTVDAEKRTVRNLLNRTLTIVKGKADSVDFII